MECKWDKKLLKELYQNPQVRDELKDLYISLYDIFNFTGNENYSKKFTFIEDMEYLQNNYYIKDYFANIPFYERVENFQTPKHTEPIILPNESMSLTFDFYKHTNSKIFEAFEYFFNQRFGHFKFHQNPFKTFYKGLTYVSSSSKNVFIEVKKRNNFQMLGTIIHEYGHAINYYLTDFNVDMMHFDLTSETTSIFMELIAYDFFSKYHEFTEEAEIEKKIFYSTFTQDKDILLEKYELVDTSNQILEERDFAFFHSFFKRLKKQLEMTENELKVVLETPASIIMPYSYSTLIALELYSIYQNDPEFAFYLLFKFINTKAKNNIEIDHKIKELGINPTQSIDSFVKSLKW